MADFKTRLEALQRELAGKHLYEQAEALLHFHLEWAAALEPSGFAGAIEQYQRAEHYQSTIGTFATGSGEGLASMAALYDLMGRRADVTERWADTAENMKTKRERLKEALTLWTRIDGDPNGQGRGTPAQERIARLRAKLAALPADN